MKKIIVLCEQCRNQYRDEEKVRQICPECMEKRDNDRILRNDAVRLASDDWTQMYRKRR